MKMTESDVSNLREFLLRGGSAYFDDFHGAFDWQNFEQEIRRVFPDRDRLLAGLSRLRKAPDRWHTYAEVARSPRLDPVLAEAAHGVVRRSRRLRRLDIRTRRAVVKWWVTRGPFARREGVSRP